MAIEKRTEEAQEQLNAWLMRQAELYEADREAQEDAEDSDDQKEEDDHMDGRGDPGDPEGSE